MGIDRKARQKVRMAPLHRDYNLQRELDRETTRYRMAFLARIRAKAKK